MHFLSVCALLVDFLPSILMDGSIMDDLQFYVLFACVSVISVRQEDDNESLCAMKPYI